MAQKTTNVLTLRKNVIFLILEHKKQLFEGIAGKEIELETVKQAL
jgi:hypothetical protein